MQLVSSNKTVDFDDVQEGRRVLELESKAIKVLADNLGADFSKAVDILFSVKGRVILTGMGKSGHIARKIGSTMASTGTPSTFVHPAEASHGDLGMVTNRDVIVALSNSGETSELSDILVYAKKYNVPIIGITSKDGSTLAKTADTKLILPKIEEACPLGLAPTTSTTLMIALGDALAVAVLKRKGFSASDFSMLHPGGKLGQKLMCVEKLMHQGADIPLVSRNSKMSDVLISMTAKGFGCTGVTDDFGNLVGIITDGDLRRHIENLLGKTAADVMSPKPKVTEAKILVEDAVAKMNSHSITSLFVVAKKDDAKPVGILHIHDCLRAGHG